MKKFMSVFWLVFVSAAVMLTAAFSANAAVTDIQAGELTISGDGITEGEDYTYTGNVLTISSSKEVTVSGTTTSDRIVVDSENGANITLSDVSVTSSGAAFAIARNTEGTVTITLAGKNTLESGTNCAGLQKTSNDCELIIQGDGELEATGKSGGAGIGGYGYYGTGAGGNGENITIISGTVTATGGGGAGIGGGCNGAAKNITISGGTVTATSTGGGAGIGGGQDTGSRNGAKAENITISGGTVTATSEFGAGIGAGQDDTGSDAHAKNITISGGTVTAITKGGRNVGIGPMTNSCAADDTVYIKGTDETHCPIVYTNSIRSANSGDKEKTPDEGGYWGIVFEGPTTARTEDDFKEGIVYGNGKEVDLSERTEAYVLGAGKKLTVLSGVTFKPSNEFELNGASDTEKSILYLKAGANLEYWYEMTKNEFGEIQHEEPSTYGWYYSDEEELYNGAELIDPDLWDEVSHLYINDDTYREGIVLCNICGKLEPHNYDPTGSWEKDDTHHWHLGECDRGTDCSIDGNEVKVCSYTSDGKLDNGKHEYNFDDVPEYKDGKWIFKCTVCEYENPMEIPVIQLVKVDGENNPLAGAEFGLYSDANCTMLLTSATSANNAGKAVAAFESGFGGGNYIKPGTTYYIKEIKAPEGYTLSDKVFTARVAIVDGEGKVTYGAAGSEEPPVCENIANIPDEPDDPTPDDPTPDDPTPDDPTPDDPTPDDPTPDDPTPDDPTPDDPTPDDPTPDDPVPDDPDDPKPDDNHNPDTGVGIGAAGLVGVAVLIDIIHASSAKKGKHKRK